MTEKNIVLMCSDGMSTSLIARKMQEKANESGYQARISAHGLAKLNTVGKEADVILLGPQVRFNLKKVQTALPDTPIGVIDMRVYGRVDGISALKQAKELLGE